MTLRISKLVLPAILLASMINVTLMDSREAAAAPTRLTKAQDTELPLVYYDYGGETREKTFFRTDGDYEWRWSISSGESLISTGKNKEYVSYSGLNGFNFTADAYGQRTGMLAIPPDDGLIKLSSGNYYSVDVDDSTLMILEEDKEERISPIRSAEATIYDAWKKPLFQLQYYISEQPFAAELVEDPNGNFIVLGIEGIVSYGATGKRNWVYREDIVVDTTYDFAKRSNVYEISIDKNGKIFVKTGDHLLTFDLDGQLLQSVAYKPLLYELSENSHLQLEENEDGLVFWDDTFITPEQAVKQYYELIEEINSIVDVTRWSKGSYTTDGTSLVSLDSKGNRKWSFKKYTAGVPENIVADKDGNVFFSDARGNIYGLDEKGNEKFHLTRAMLDGASIQLALTPDGDLIGTIPGLGLFCISKRHENLIVDDMPIALGAKTMTNNGVFLVPYREAFTKLGIKATMDSSKKWTIATSKTGKTLKFRNGDTVAYVNGKAKKQTVAPQRIGGVDYIPAQLIADLLGKRMEWDKLTGTASIGSDEQLAEASVRQFLTYIENGQELLANDLLSVQGASFAAKAPGIKREDWRERWIIDILSLKTTKISATEYRVETKQHNRKYVFSRNYLDETNNFSYQVKLSSDGRWKISSSDFTAKRPK